MTCMYCKMFLHLDVFTYISTLTKVKSQDIHQGKTRMTQQRPDDKVRA